MFNAKCLKNDIRQILREPVLFGFLFIPFISFVVVKIAITYGFPIMFNHFELNLMPYMIYISIAMLLMTPNLLGTIFAFLMIDERDSQLSDLMYVTPMGYSGYIFNRLFLPVIFTVFYTFIGVFILDIPHNSLLFVLVASLFLAVESVFFSIAIFLLSDDKVKALTYVKALNMVILLVFVDLSKIKWLILVGKIFPHYWIGQLLLHPFNFQILFINIIVHTIWSIIMLKFLFSSK